MWFIDHQAEHFGVSLGLFGFLGKQFCDVVADFDGPLIQWFHAAWEEVGTVKNQFFNSFRVFQGEFQGDVTPRANASNL